MEVFGVIQVHTSSGFLMLIFSRYSCIDLPMFSWSSSPFNGSRRDCGCGGAGACHCPTSSFPSPFRPFSEANPPPFRVPTSSFVIPPVLPTEIPPDHIPAWALPAQAPRTPFRATPILPYEPPSQYQWNFPTGNLSWSPHPAPHPNISAVNFWPPDNMLRGIPPTPRNFPNTALNPQQAARLTGGWPLPGAAPWWTPSIWPQAVDSVAQPIQLAPCLIPNPADGENPQIIWDISQTPYIAEWIIGDNTVNLRSQFNEKATIPAVDEIRITLHDEIVRRMWGPITVRNPRQQVLVWDVLHAIYDHLRKPITQEELSFLQSLDPSNHTIFLDALQRRCAATPSLSESELSQGLRRVDALGDRRKFWGLWIKYNGDGSWHLNLGLIA